MRILLGARGKNQKNPTIIIKLNQMSKITDKQLEKLHKQQTALNSLLIDRDWETKYAPYTVINND